MRIIERESVPWACLAIIVLTFAQVGQAQQRVPSTQPAGLPFPIQGPPPPVPPEVIARDTAGGVTVRAVRLTGPLRVDGRLEEAVYTNVASMSDFIQNDPVEGQPATERTEVWILFDDDNVYVVARCWESRPERLVANEMRRDNTRIVSNDNFAWMFDTFYDRRNGVIFEVSAVGGRIDAQVTNEQQINLDWNPVWDVAVAKFEQGWAMEAALPFRSLRYRPGVAQVWGFQARRINRWKNESSYLTPLSAAQANRGHFRASLAATLVGLQAPGGSRNLEIKPYAIADLTSDLNARPQVTNDFSGDIGLDVKYGITQNLTTDFTYNPDFAQVEADEQQVNLTRFSLFFPEKREFFLENQGIFTFGGAGAGAFGGGGTTPVLFYSRQIGLSRGQEVPIDAGGRLTGRVGAFSLGVLNIQTDDLPEAGAAATNFSVVRVRRDLLRRSSIGALFTGRSVSIAGTGSAETYGVDGLFSFYENLNINTYWAKTTTPRLGEDDLSYRAQLDYGGDRYGVQLEHLVVGDHFNPEVGFLLRDDFERSFGSFRLSPRPQGIALIRKVTWEGRVDYITDRAGRLETRETQGQFGIEFENSDQFNATYTRSYEFLEQPFRIAPGVIIPVGGYGFQDVQTGFTFGQQRRLSGTLSIQHGSFFSGDKTTVGVNQGRVELTPQFSLEPSYAYNRVDLPEGLFATHLVRTRTTYTMTPLMFVSALVQYNSSSDSLSTNLRLRWEYTPGSELFIVYNEDRDTDPLMPDRFSDLRNRAVVIKVNRLFRF